MEPCKLSSWSGQAAEQGRRTIIDVFWTEKRLLVRAILCACSRKALLTNLTSHWLECSVIEMTEGWLESDDVMCSQNNQMP